MYCPNCGYKQMCGCSASRCKKQLLKSGLKGEIRVGGNEIKCANCGLTAHADWWTSLDCDIWKLTEEKNCGKRKK